MTEPPLSGIRVLDLTRVLAGPYCTLCLGDLGAEVIKVEHPRGGDETRRFMPMTADGHASYFLTVNRNKRSLAMDLKHPAGRDALLRLVAASDVVVENFRAGVMERLGLGFERLKEVRPDLIYCAVSGYGRSGPRAQDPGFDPVAQAESGLMSMTGAADGEPTRVGVSLVDMTAGLFAAQAVLAALLRRQAGGGGDLIDVSLHETALNMLVNFAGSYLTTGQVPHRVGNSNQVTQPAGMFETADEPLVIAVANNGQFERLTSQVLGRPELARQPEFAENQQRVANASRLRAVIAEILHTRTRAHWLGLLKRANVPGGPVNNVAEALSEEVVGARETVMEIPHSALGGYRTLRSPMRFAAAGADDPRGAPLLGEHSVPILRDLAKFGADEIDALVAAGVVAGPPQ